MLYTHQKGALPHSRLAEQDRSRLSQDLSHLAFRPAHVLRIRVLICDAWIIRPSYESDGGVQSVDLKIVLERDRESVQWPDGFTGGCQVGIEGCGC